MQDSPYDGSKQARVDPSRSDLQETLIKTTEQRMDRTTEGSAPKIVDDLFTDAISAANEKKNTLYVKSKAHSGEENREGQSPSSEHSLNQNHKLMLGTSFLR